jgi:O-Antigen ligase
MNDKLFNQMPMLLYAALGLGLSLFGANLAFSSNGFFSHFFQEIVDFIRDPQTQWLMLACVCFYFTTLMLLKPHRQKASFWRSHTSELWMIAAFVVAAFSYVVDYPASTQSAQPLILFAGATLGKGASVLAAFKSRKAEGENGNKPEHGRNNLAVLVASLLVILLALASIWETNAGRGFGYDGNARCSGPWDNPNIFGLLMGTGIALAVGLLLQSPMSKAKTQKVEVGKYSVVILCLLAGIPMARGLLHSYSRGAWVATICGLGYLVWRGGQALISKRQRHSCILPLNRNWLPFSVILASFFLLVFWHFRQTNWHPARRALSVVNTTDFSWRNRIVAWEGNLQIMAEHPWLGTGWNQPEPLYEHYYLPLKLNESAAIEMNDYLMLGATLGIPALCCFAIYLWLSLGRNFEVRSQNSELATLEWLQIICHAGAIVLLVGFWFDGGLFKLPTASIFWILLELGSCESPQESSNANS